MRISDWSSDGCSSDLSCGTGSGFKPLNRTTASTASVRASSSRGAASQAFSSSAPAGVAASKGAASLTSTAGVVARPEREHVHAGLGHGDHVFPLRRQPAVLGDHGPAVGQHLGVALALVDHRLDGEGHALLQHQALARPAVVQHLRLVVVDLADAVAAVLAPPREALALRVMLGG